MIPYEDLCAALDRWSGLKPGETLSPEGPSEASNESLPSEAIDSSSRSDEPSNELDIGDVLGDELT